MTAINQGRHYRCQLRLYFHYIECVFLCVCVCVSVCESDRFLNTARLTEKEERVCGRLRQSGFIWQMLPSQTYQMAWCWEGWLTSEEQQATVQQPLTFQEVSAVVSVSCAADWRAYVLLKGARPNDWCRKCFCQDVISMMPAMTCQGARTRQKSRCGYEREAEWSHRSKNWRAWRWKFKYLVSIIQSNIQCILHPKILTGIKLQI